MYREPSGTKDIFYCSLNNFFPNLHKGNLSWLSSYIRGVIK